MLQRVGMDDQIEAAIRQGEALHVIRGIIGPQLTGQHRKRGRNPFSAVAIEHLPVGKQTMFDGVPQR